MIPHRWKSVAFWTCLALYCAFAMRVAVRAPHSVDSRLITVLVIAILLLGMNGGRLMQQRPSAALWTTLAASIATAFGLSQLMTDGSSFEVWILLITALNAGRAMTLETPELSLDVQK